MRGYKPETVIIETTARCNLNCIFCGSDCKNAKNPKELSIEEWEVLVDNLAELGTKRIVLSGGEPTLKENVGELMRHISSKKLQWGMVSNGFNFSLRLLEVMAAHKPYALGLSIDGIKETHNKLRGNSRSFQRIVVSINELQKREIPLSVNTTIHKLNYRELPLIAKFILENKIFGWQIQLAMPFGRMKDKQNLLLSQEEFLWICLFVEKIRKLMPFVNIAAADCFAWAPTGKIRDGKWSGCGGGIRSLGIDALGNVRGCLSMAECPPEGSIRERKIADIWQDRSLFSYNRQFSSDNASEFCAKCKKILICKGGCSSQSFSMAGKFHQGVYCWYKTRKGDKENEKRGV